MSDSLSNTEHSDYEADVRFLRDRGCLCPLRIDPSATGPMRAIPATGCNRSGDRRVCAERFKPMGDE